MVLHYTTLHDSQYFNASFLHYIISPIDCSFTWFPNKWNKKNRTYISALRTYRGDWIKSIRNRSAQNPSRPENLRSILRREINPGLVRLRHLLRRGSGSDLVAQIRIQFGSPSIASLDSLHHHGMSELNTIASSNLAPLHTLLVLSLLFISLNPCFVEWRREKGALEIGGGEEEWLPGRDSVPRWNRILSSTTVEGYVLSGGTNWRGPVSKLNLESCWMQDPWAW